MDYSDELIEEVLDELIEEYGTTSKELQEFIRSLGDGTAAEQTHEPVSILEFIEDNYFLGGTFADTLWESTTESCVEIKEGNYNEAVFTGAIGVAKTTRAQIVAAYDLYVLSTYVNPQEALGLMPNTDIVVAMINKTEALARKVTYKGFRKLVENIQYFKDNFAFDTQIDNEMRFPNGITVMPSNADNDKLLGMAVVSGIVDEINFFQYVEDSKQSKGGGTFDQAVEIYNGLVRRIKSRFEGIEHLTGTISVVASRSHKGDFTSIRIDQIEQEKLENNGETRSYVSSVSQWDFIPALRADGTRRFSETTFMVAIGSGKNPSAIIEMEEESIDREIIHVPDNFRNDFDKDINGSLRDFAGRVPESGGNFLDNPTIIWDSTELFETKPLFTRLFLEETWNLEDGFPEPNPNYMMNNPNSIRFLHLDLSLTGDRTGICLSHSPNDDPSNKLTTLNRYEQEKAPNLWVDMILGIEAPMGGQINYERIRKFIYYLKQRLGFKIKYVSTDGYQSADMRQILESKGFEVSSISTEQEIPYTTLRNAFINGKIQMNEYPLLISELLGLVQDPKTRRVDHINLNSKDLADSLCASLLNVQRVHENGDLYNTVSLMKGLYTRGRPTPNFHGR